MTGFALARLYSGARLHFGRGTLRAALLVGVVGTFGLGTAASAQAGNSGRISQEVVQPLPARDNMDLNEALARLGRNPRDIEALIDAGNAALAMGDADAAIGFFGRANQFSPANARVKAGLASAMVRNEDPFDAIRLFDEAERGGGMDSAFIADRGLAYDLVGDNAAAQRYYRQVLASGPNDEVTRRLALSLAMAGDKQGAEQVLAPLLTQKDRAAFRTRAFALAILGQTEAAVSIADASLPKATAESMAPYLRYMPRLTRAQQAAAANFGHFPRASEIGRDDPRVARYAASAVREADASKGGAAGSAVATSNARRGQARTSRSRASRSAAARTLPPEPQVSREISIPPVAGRPATKEVAAAPVPAPVPAPAPRVAKAPSSSGIMGPVLPQGEAARQAVSAPAPAPASSPQLAATPELRRNLTDVFAEFAKTTPGAAPAPGAVDIRKITPARPKPPKAKEEAAKPLPPSHPSRIWVQLAVGRDKDALGFDWRRMARTAKEAFGGKKANISEWGQNNRLLAGPFPTQAEAIAFVTQLQQADIKGPFVWTSPAGQVVDALSGQ